MTSLKPSRKPRRKLLVVRLKAGILNIAARQNRVLGGVTSERTGGRCRSASAFASSLPAARRG